MTPIETIVAFLVSQLAGMITIGLICKAKR